MDENKHLDHYLRDFDRKRDAELEQAEWEREQREERLERFRDPEPPGWRDARCVQ